MSGFLCTPAAYLLVAVFFVIALGAYAALGLHGAIAMRARGWIPRELSLLAAFGIAAVIAYALFWLYLWKPAVGRISSLGALLMAGAAYLDAGAWRRVRAAWDDPDIRTPLLLTGLIGLLYIALTYAWVFPRQSCAATDEAFVVDRILGTGSPDYLIQKIWADGLYHGRPPWNYMLDPDLSRTTVADRPPLLGSMALLLYPLLPESLRFLGFMAATTAASLAWLAALWALLRCAGTPIARTALAALAVSQTYYFWHSSIFTWPKALSGAFAVGAIVLLLRPAIHSVPNRPAVTLVAAVLAALSVLGHFSAALLLLVTALLLLHPRLFPGWRTSVAAGAVFLFIGGSYFLLKSTMETNLSNQTKYTLSVPDTSPVEPAEYKGLSTIEAVKRAYGKITLREAIGNKLYNLGSIFRPGCFLACPGESAKQGLWSSELLPILGSMKLLNFGWLLFLVPLVALFPSAAPWRRSLQCLEFSPQVRRATLVYLAVAAAGLLVYGIASFRQGVSNILSSGFMLLLFAAVAARMFSLPYRWIWAFVAAPAAYFTALVYSMGLADRLHHNPPLLALLVVVVGAVLVLAARMLTAHQPPRHV